MAVAAVAQFERQQPLPIVTEGLPWLHADSVPELAQARQEGLAEGRQLLDARLQLLRDGEYAQVPHTVDPLSTATRFIAAEQQYGPNHSKTHTARHSIDVDSTRLYAEAMRRLTWEYHPPIEQPYDSKRETYTFDDRSLTEMVDQGITPIAEPEETEYRLGEKVEETTYRSVRQLGRLAVGNIVFLAPAQPVKSETEVPAEIAPSVTVITLSECADWAINAYKNGNKKHMGGYAPEIEKHMIRGVRYDRKTDSRWQEQLGFSGKHITHGDIIEAMQALKVVPADVRPTKQEVRATQMINVNGQGVIEVMKLLDEIASRRTGLRIFMGEVIPAHQEKDYARVPEMAMERERQLEPEGRKLSAYLIELERKQTDHWMANELVEAFVKKRLFEKVRHDPAQAAVVFDKKTADDLAEVIRLRQTGLEDLARRREAEIFEAAPPPGYCSPGSCGLAEVNKDDENIKKALKEMDAKEGETVVADVERKCPHCHEKKLIYSFTSSVVKAFCMGCESKKKK